jgi:hypothetical protein
MATVVRPASFVPGSFKEYDASLPLSQWIYHPRWTDTPRCLKSSLESRVHFFPLVFSQTESMMHNMMMEMFASSRFFLVLLLVGSMEIR